MSQPIRVGPLTLKNRIVMAPMAINAPTADGCPSAQTIALYEARARGGVGMIIMGGTVSNQRSWDESRFRPVLRTDIQAYVPDFAKIADAVHAHGVAIIGQVGAGFGRIGVPRHGRPIISASPLNVVMYSSAMVTLPGGKISTPTPRAATLAEIEQCERDVIDSAVWLHRAGFDGIEVAAMMSYLLASFLSPRTNWRTDQYGGSLENRSRILVNIVRGIRERLGPEFVIGLRIAANDYMSDGLGPEGFASVAKEVEKAGIDYVALVWGCYESMHLTPPDVDGAGLVATGDALVFKRTLSVPVIIGGLHDPTRAAQAIAEGYGDMVMLARQMLADPDYARKATEGHLDDIVRCDRNGVCVKRLMLGMPIRCTRNPRMGVEARPPGALPSLDRVLKAPIEQVALRLMSSKTLLNLAGRFMKSDA